MEYIALDIETIGLNPYGGTIWMLSVTTARSTKVYHDCNGGTEYFKPLRAILEDPKVCKVIHNGEFDMPYIEMNTGIKIKNVWDTMLAETVIQGRQLPRENRDEEMERLYGVSLKVVLPRYGFPIPDKSVRENFINRKKGVRFTKEEIKYAEGDTRYLLQLQKAQEYVLKRDGLLEVALLENKVVEKVAQMKVKGLGISKKIWLETADANMKKSRALIAKLPNTVANWNSPAQVKKFFKDRGTIIESFKFLEQTQKLTNDKLLRQYIEARDLYSDTTTYGAKWLNHKKTGASFIDPDGRIRCNYKQILNTGRFATSNPNILALPKEGNQRGAIIPVPGCVFLDGDFDGQEIGIMAAAAGEDLWIDALLRGESVHALVASRLFATDWERSTEKGCTFPKKCECEGHKDKTGYPYYLAKKLNFMLAYGGGHMKFNEITGIPMLESKVIITKYKRLIPKLNAYLESNAKYALENHETYSADPYRRRMVLNETEDWMYENDGKNYGIQGSAANMLKLAMISLPDHIPVVLPFHDQLLMEVPAKNAERDRKTVEKIMSDASDYITGIKGLVKITPKITTSFLKIKKPKI